MGQLIVRVNFGNGNPDDNKEIPVGPPFATQEEAFAWGNSIVGAETIQAVFYTEFLLGSTHFNVVFT